MTVASRIRARTTLTSHTAIHAEQRPFSRKLSLSMMSAGRMVIGPAEATLTALMNLLSKTALICLVIMRLLGIAVKKL